MRKILFVVALFAGVVAFDRVFPALRHAAGHGWPSGDHGRTGRRGGRGAEAGHGVLVVNEAAGVVDPRTEAVVANALKALQDDDWTAYRALAVSQDDVEDRRQWAQGGHNGSRHGVILVQSEEWLRAEFDHVASLPVLHSGPDGGLPAKAWLHGEGRGEGRWQVALLDARNGEILHFYVLLKDDQPRITQIVTWDKSAEAESWAATVTAQQ